MRRPCAFGAELPFVLSVFRVLTRRQFPQQSRPRNARYPRLPHHAALPVVRTGSAKDPTSRNDAGALANAPQSIPVIRVNTPRARQGTRVVRDIFLSTRSTPS